MRCWVRGHGEIVRRSDAMGDSYCPDCQVRHYMRYRRRPGPGLRIIAAEAKARGGTCQFVLVYGESGPQVRCLSRFEDGVLEWHHRDPAEKIATISALAGGPNLDVLAAELAKCDLLCRWHHRSVERNARDDSRWTIATATEVAA